MPFSVNDIADATCRLPDKCSAADPIPTYMLKWISDQIVPLIMSFFNRTLASGDSCRFPVSFKVASVTHVLKKPVLGPTDTGCYRPISNLSVLSKLLEPLVVRQLLVYLHLPTYFCRFNLVSIQVIPPRSPCLHVLSDILLSTVAILPLRSFWTRRRHWTQSITTSSFNASK